MDKVRLGTLMGAPGYPSLVEKTLVYLTESMSANLILTLFYSWCDVLEWKINPIKFKST